MRYIIKTPFAHIPTSAYAYVRRRMENCFMILGLALAWVGAAKFMFMAFGLEADPRQIVVPVSVALLLRSEAIAQVLLASPATLVFSAVVFAPIVEELVFRALPLTLTRSLPDDKRQMIVLVVSGVLFGVAHGHPFLIFVQGVVGVLFALLYLRNGPNRLVSYGSVVFTHAMYNFLVTLMSV